MPGGQRHPRAGNAPSLSLHPKSKGALVPTGSRDSGRGALPRRLLLDEIGASSAERRGTAVLVGLGFSEELLARPVCLCVSVCVCVNVFASEGNVGGTWREPVQVTTGPARQRPKSSLQHAGAYFIDSACYERCNPRRISSHGCGPVRMRCTHTPSSAHG